MSIWLSATSPKDADAHYNALLTQLTHRFSNPFTVDTQYRLSRNTDQGSQDFFIDNGLADFDVTHDFKTWGVWTPTLFRGGQSWVEKAVGGWTLSGILSAHSGFPWSPRYCNTGNNVVYPNSGFGCLRPARYAGGAGSDFSNATFMRPSGNFPNGALSYFPVPTWPGTGIPPAPQVGRNGFRGPRYLGFDATLAKAFGLPRMKVLGENARLNLQLNAYNVFDKLNLNPTQNNIISNDGKTSDPVRSIARCLCRPFVEIQHGSAFDRTSFAMNSLR